MGKYKFYEIQLKQRERCSEVPTITCYICNNPNVLNTLSHSLQKGDCENEKRTTKQKFGFGE